MEARPLQVQLPKVGYEEPAVHFPGLTPAVLRARSDIGSGTALSSGWGRWTGG